MAPQAPPRLAEIPASPILTAVYDLPPQRQTFIPSSNWNVNNVPTNEDIPLKLDTSAGRDDAEDAVSASSLRPSSYLPGDPRSSERRRSQGLCPSPKSERSVSENDDTFTIRTDYDVGYTAACEEYASEGGIATTPADQADILTQVGSVSKTEPLDVLLRDRFVTRGGNSSGTRQEWIPIGSLFQLVNESQVYHELTEAFKAAHLRYQDKQISDYARKICQFRESEYHDGKTSHRKIFAILALMDRIVDAPFFVDRGFSDRDLPVENVRNFGKPGFRTCGGGRETTFEVPDHWKPHNLDSFINYQEHVMAPFFELDSNSVAFYNLNEKSVLPFIEDESSHRRTYGYHGTVYRVKIHPDHHNGHGGLDDDDDQRQNPSFAVKELVCKDGKEDVFQEEIEAWRQAAGTALHPHLIRLLATWRQSQVWNLLLPWADGNLWDFYEKHPEPQPDLSQAKWMIEQLLGLAGALQRIHRSGSGDLETKRWGIHGDIKPENILWYKDSADPNNLGKFVICDFGFTRFHTKASRSRAHSEGENLKYRAPEQGSISRAYDMWSFGCVLLEFVTWYLAGHRHVEDTFYQRRRHDDRGEQVFAVDKFFNFDHNHRPCKKESVEKWIEDLRRHRHCSALCSDLLDLMKRDLFVINYKERGDCRNVVYELRSIQRKLNAQGESYGLAMEQESPIGPWPTPQDTEALPTGGRQVVIQTGWNAPVHTTNTWLSRDSEASHEGNVMARGQRPYGTVDQVLRTPSQPQTATANPRRSPSQRYSIRIDLEDADDTAPLLGTSSGASQSYGAAETSGSRQPLSTETTLEGELHTGSPDESQGTLGHGNAPSISSGIAPSLDQKGKKASHTSPFGTLFRAIFGSCLAARD
ncbi:hypothetical protein N8I77_005359 [Diaporthe amygdali]|uniref:Protein kinase domain-containing protein n=1 Tax=Phomopsis amygdali TaxID=1214568 RepID=A0AAD9W3B3_PHOAM|nr:hypothetical protein N8I77_005359 [Diaporthe amygdali]